MDKHALLSLSTMYVYMLWWDARHGQERVGEWTRGALQVMLFRRRLHQTDGDLSHSTNSRCHASMSVTVVHLHMQTPRTGQVNRKLATTIKLMPAMTGMITYAPRGI